MKEIATRPKAAVFHPWLVEGGGSEAVALWAAQALAGDYDVDILTMGQTPLEKLNAAYGTSLEEGRTGVVRIPLPRLLARRGDALRAALARRAFRSRAASYDFLLSSYNVMDFGRPGLQYVSDFSFDDSLRRALFLDPVRWREMLRSPTLWRRLYLAAGRGIARESSFRWRANRTLANSHWTRRLLAEAFGIESEVVYPPVAAPGRLPAWEGRDPGFVTVGRLVPEKRVDELADIIGLLRAAGRDIHLHVLGRLSEDACGRALVRRAAAEPAWLHLEGAAYGDRKWAFLRGHRFGISGCRHEAFGLSAAEMVRAGMIVWVPQSGGQVEIVDHPELVFDSPSDAAAKIGRILADPDRQRALREHLQRRARLFTGEVFMDGIRRAATDLREESHGR